LGNSGVGGQLAASREWLISMELVRPVIQFAIEADWYNLLVKFLHFLVRRHNELDVVERLFSK
jgi:hypothetical protein